MPRQASDVEVSARAGTQAGSRHNLTPDRLSQVQQATTDASAIHAASSRPLLSIPSGRQPPSRWATPSWGGMP